MGKCVIFSAPSGAGKTTIVRHLLGLNLGLEFSVSATSRSPRNGEKDGEAYYFLSVGDFKNKISSGDFVEWEEVYSEQFYGTLKSEIERIWQLGKHVVFDVDVVGGKNLKSIFKEQALAVFVQPPSIKALEERLRTRGTESEASIMKRLDKAALELTFESYFDVIIINDDLDDAKAEAAEVVTEFLNS
ncbi:MAG: guanylate kinase [Cryomorphaceae bacterium]|nr:guanylate kinase [Cryomorphaceae bacterium]